MKYRTTNYRDNERTTKEEVNITISHTSYSLTIDLYIYDLTVYINCTIIIIEFT